MSGSMNARYSGGKYRKQLLVTVSAAVLATCLVNANRANAADGDADRPLLWIDVGAQLERNTGQPEPFIPSFEPAIGQLGFDLPSKIQQPRQYSLGRDGGISFEPGDWIFSASIHYGRSAGTKRVHQQTAPAPERVHNGNRFSTITPVVVKFSETRARNSEAHTVLDFQAGKDFGLGLFGRHGETHFSGGVRFAQFTSKSNADMYADPDFFLPTDLKYKHNHQLDTESAQNSRSFRGFGPSLSWNASAPLAGNEQDVELNVDWGLNAAALFGRQKARGQHQSNIAYYRSNFKYKHVHRTSHTTPHDRSRSVVVPNMGGFAGFSVRYPNAKISIGYRADMFFGAMDDGIDTRKSTTRGFFGPFATISVGIGG